MADTIFYTATVARPGYGDDHDGMTYRISSRIPQLFHGIPEEICELQG